MYVYIYIYILCFSISAYNCVSNVMLQVNHNAQYLTFSSTVIEQKVYGIISYLSFIYSDCDMLTLILH